MRSLSAIPGDKMHNYRTLKESEIEQLIRNGNSADDWQKIQVRNGFDPNRIKNSVFIGKIYIGELNVRELRYASLTLPVGIYSSWIRNCIIGNNAAIHNIRYMNNYQIGDSSFLFNIDELSTDKNAVFGMGYKKDGKRNWLEISNDNGGRKILPFADMRPADAQLWSRYGTSAEISEKLIQFTDRTEKTPNNLFGYIGTNTVIKNCQAINDSNFGEGCVLSAVVALKNCTIQSSVNEPTIIEDGVILTNSLIGYANRVNRGVNADHIYSCRNVELEHGLRIFHTFISANSTISCGEVANNLLLPYHVQHHNNSFLIASTILGQSNIAAGATIGSNHNSRAADGEILAERGFWPGLCSNFKHNSYFSHFSLIAKGNYDSELNIQLPFSLISVNPADNMVQIMPGFWFQYNMYALGRNRWKFKNRDKRKVRDQFIETDFLAPDTVQAMLNGINILIKAINVQSNQNWSVDDLKPEMDKNIDLKLDGMVNKSKMKVIKPIQGILLYRRMIEYYAAQQLVNLISKHPQEAAFMDQIRELSASKTTHWINLGGQLMPQADLIKLLADIKNDSLYSWQDIHQRYDNLLNHYSQHKVKFALHNLTSIRDINSIETGTIIETIKNGVNTATLLLENAKSSRQKDFSDPFRKMVYADDDQMRAVLGSADEDPFLTEFEAETNSWRALAESLIKNLQKI